MKEKNLAVELLRKLISEQVFIYPETDLHDSMRSTTRSTTCDSCLLPQTLATIGWLTAARLLRFCLTGLCEQSIISFTVDVYGSGTVIITSVTACSTAKFMPLSAAVSLCRIPTDRTTLTGVLRVCRKDFWLWQRSFVFQHLTELIECPGDHDVPVFQTNLFCSSAYPG